MEKEIKILMLEDMEEDAGLIDEVLQAEKIVFSRVRVDTREEFTDALKKFRPDVVLSDHSLPSFNSIEALKICHENGLNLPFILVTGTVSEEFAVNCLKRGADDYVLKSNLTRLPMAIRYALRRRRHVKGRKKYCAGRISSLPRLTRSWIPLFTVYRIICVHPFIPY